MHIGETSVEALPLDLDVIFALFLVLTVMWVEMATEELVADVALEDEGISEGPEVDFASWDEEEVEVEVKVEGKVASNFPSVGDMLVVSTDSEASSVTETVGTVPAGSTSVEANGKGSNEGVVEFNPLMFICGVARTQTHQRNVPKSA